MADDKNKDDDQDPSMKEWDSMLEDDEAPKAGDAGAKASMSQDEIDNLLGVVQAEKDKSSTGVRAILEKALMSYERLPMLEIVFDRFARMLTTSLRNLTSENIDVDIRLISSLRFGDYIDAIPMPALLNVFKVIEWDNFGIIALDGSFIYSMVDVLFGGRKIQKPVHFDGRPFTTIEQNVAQQIGEIVLQDLSSAFEPLSPSTFAFDRTETNPRFATIARPADAAILLELRIDMEDRGGKLEVMFPYNTLEPIRNLLLQVFMGEKFGKDPTWELHLEREIFSTTITMDAILDKKTTQLADILKLKVGNTIVLDAQPNDPITLRCSGVDMFSGKLGKVHDSVSVRIENAINKKLQEAMQ